MTFLEFECFSAQNMRNHVLAFLLVDFPKEVKEMLGVMLCRNKGSNMRFYHPLMCL